MIIAYTGLPGGGKSLSALQDYVLPQLRKERHVFCNIVGLDPMCISMKLGVTTSDVNRFLHRFSLSFNDDSARGNKEHCVMNEDGSMYYANAEGLDGLVCDVMVYRESVLIIDECHEYLSPSNYVYLASFKQYLSMARHYGHDVVLITQHISDIWEPLRNRIHETHNFARGVLGFRTQYRESVYYGSNILKDPGYTRQRINDKSLYRLYRSHDGGAKEHLGYISIWKNKKFVSYLLLFLVLVSYGGYTIFSKGIFGDLDKKAETAAPAPEHSAVSNVVYVKYVVCGAYDCKATRPDGTTLTLPLDYASGRYPIEIRRYGNAQGNASIFNPAGIPGASPK
jgi:zona occludens toxin (predicted ATPase)